MKVLVLGWEYPPIVAGGLGAACHGLTTALAGRGHEILLIVPKGGSRDSSADGPPVAHVDAPGIRRIEIDLTPGPDEGEGLVLSPYIRAGSQASGPLALSPLALGQSSSGPSSEAARGGVAPPPERVSAQGHLYGQDLHLALERYAARVHDAVLGLEFDVIHAHDWMTIPAAARLRMSSGHAPLCLHVHSTAFDRAGGGDLRDPIRRVEAVGIRIADRVAAVSDYSRRVILEQYGPDPSLVDVVHNAAPPKVAGGSANTAGNTAGKRPSLKGEAGPPTALFLGRLTRQKGASFFLRAAALVCEGRPNARFIVAGDGEELSRLVEESASLGIARNVLFTGSIGDACRDRAYRDASVFVLSSLSEPFGLTPLEALRQGTPVILSDQAGVREVLPSAPHVPPWDRRALAREIERVFADPVHARDLVKSGLRDLDGCDWAASAKALEGTLQAAIDGNGRRDRRQLQNTAVQGAPSKG